MNYIATFPVGRTVDNARAYLTIELRTEQGTKTTTDHQTITNPITLSISGNVTGRYGFESGGQNRDDFRTENLNSDRMVISPDDLATILDIWDRWHLNTLKGECIHQDHAAHVDYAGETTYPGGWFTSPRYEHVTDEQTAKCPEGYRYGSAWLTEPLPDEVIATVRRIGDTYKTRSI